jgi:hypothetical protein
MGNLTTVPAIERRLEQAVLGGQGLLVIAAVPSGAANGLIGQNLVDVGALTVGGDYYCLVPLAGMVTEVEVSLKATFASGTVTSDLGSLYFVRNFSTPATWVEKTAGANDGALTTATLQTSDLTGLRGEQYASLKLTLAGGASATFTQAEYNGI